MVVGPVESVTKISVYPLTELTQYLHKLRDLDLRSQGSREESRIILHSLYGILSVISNDQMSLEIRHLEIHIAEARLDPAELQIRKEQLLTRLETFIHREATSPATQEALESFLSELKDMISTLALKQNKKVKALRVHTEEGVHRDFQRLQASVIHVLRNAVDHGIETPEVRQSLQKSEAGQIDLEMKIDETDNTFQIVISDDGAGIPVEILPQIFDLGFSSKKSVSEVSGMGVGLTAVKRTVAELGGTVEIHSLRGSGTTVRLSVPLSN